jgi:beta-phosphoglucomutase
MDASEILPDVLKILKFLKNQNIPIALGSASKNARPILEKVKLLPYFDFIVDGNNVTKAKPDPEVFLIAAQKMNIEPGCCIVFEDAVAGIEAANNAKMTSVGIGEADVLSEADFNFSDFTEIDLDFIKELVRA